jgi:hypothetical protein
VVSSAKWGNPVRAWRDKIVALAARHAVPAMYIFREFAVAGVLMS